MGHGRVRIDAERHRHRHSIERDGRTAGGVCTNDDVYTAAVDRFEENAIGEEVAVLSFEEAEAERVVSCRRLLIIHMTGHSPNVFVASNGSKFR